MSDLDLNVTPGSGVAAAQGVFRRGAASMKAAAQ